LRALGHGDLIANEPAGGAVHRQVWRWFVHLDEIRPMPRMTEPEPNAAARGQLSWQVRTYVGRLLPSEIEAWARLAGIILEPWAFAAILIIDDFFVRTRNDPPQPQVAATPEGIKAMFDVFRKKKAKK
jgi:hypothetical protein